ncbi:MAG TPA: CPBP family intramembrane glutamic endopeptidase, partial [Patescibacteria group bacterium]
LFFKLLITSIIVTIFVLPYTVALSPAVAKILTPIVMAAQVIQSTIIFSISIFLGLLLAKKVGLEMPVLEGKKPVSYIKSILKLSVGMGVLSGVLIILLSFLFSSLSLTFLKAEMGVASWKGLLAAFYGGIGEEILFRLFLMTLFVWIATKVLKTREGRPTITGIWTAIIVSTVIFGLGHLGITGSLTAITPLVILRAVILNGVASLIFSWLYWKKGLESAMIAHFSADIVLHVITPIVAGLFL